MTACGWRVRGADFSGLGRFPLCLEWTGWSSLICFLAGRREASRRQESSSNSGGRSNENDEMTGTADKAACNFIRQRRILIRIPPLDRLVLATNRSTTASGRGKREEGQFLSGKWNIFGSWASCSDRVRFHRLLYRHWILRRLPVADKWNHFNDPPGSRPPLRSTTEYRL